MFRKLLMVSLITPSVLGSLIFLPSKAFGIPAFARNLEKPCITCHVAFPKLNNFGKDFEHRGFRLEGEEGKYLWDQPIPLAGKINFLYQYNNLEWDPERPTMGMVDTKSSSFDLFDVQLLTGGTLAPNVSFFGQFVFKVPGLEPDASDDIGDVSGFMMANPLETEVRTEAVWVQMNDLLPDSRLNLRIGKDHIDNDFLSLPLRLTRASRLIQIQPMLGASLHPMSVGIELNGTQGFRTIGLDYEIGVRNYGPAYDSKESNENRLGAYYTFLTSHVMGQAISIMVSGDKRGDANSGLDDDVMAYGVSFDLNWGPLNLIPGIFQYQEGKNIVYPNMMDPTMPLGAGEKLQVTSGTLEATYTILPDLLATLRYDFNQWDLDNDTLDDRKAELYVASLAWYPYPNFRWVAEYNRVSTSNMMFMRDEVGLQMLMPTPMPTDLTQDIIVLMLEVDF